MVLLIVVLGAGCGGSAVPEGVPVSVRFELVAPVGRYGPHGPIPQPLTMHEGDTGWGRLSRLLPDPLPEPVAQGKDCVSGQMVSVRLATKTEASGEVDYGPCRWPEAIQPVRLLMHTLFQRRLAAERRCKCHRTR